MGKITIGFVLFSLAALPISSNSSPSRRLVFPITKERSNLMELSSERMKKYRENMQTYTDKLDTIIKLLDHGKEDNMGGH